MTDEIKRLLRPRAGRTIAGVCAGIAAYFNVDVVFVRVAWVVLSIVPGGVLGGILAYLAAWMVMPEAQGTFPSQIRAAWCDPRLTGRLPASAAALPSTSTSMRRRSDCCGSS